MNHNLTKLYEGNNLSGDVAGVIYLPILLDEFNLSGVDVLTDENVSGVNAVFNLKKNGVLIPGAGVTINIGSKIGSVTGLNVALVKGDEIVLNLVSGAVSSPVTLNLAGDDGVSAPADGEDGADGAPGTQIRYGTGAPSNSLGIDGDYYIDQTNAFDLYHKSGGGYILLGTLKGVPGNPGLAGDDGADGATWRFGAGAPASGLGNDADLYLNQTNWDVYRKESGAWVLKGNIKGADGTGGGGIVTLLSDDFTSGAFDSAKWQTPVASNVTKTGGKLNIAITGGVSTILRTLNRYQDLDTEFIVEVPTTPQAADRYTQLLLATDDGFSYFHFIRERQGFLEGFGNNSQVFSIAYDAVQHRWWKIKLRFGAITYQTSADGASWKTIAQKSNSGLGNLFYVYFRAYNNVSASQVSEFDNFKINDLANLP